MASKRKFKSAFTVRWAPSDGKDGTDGKGVASTSIAYQLGTSGTTTPTGTWSSSVPTLTKGKYLWTRTIISYTTGNPTILYSVSYIAKDGADGDDGLPGKDGLGIKSTTINYAVGTSGTSHPTSGWQATVPAVNPGQYLWTRTEWTYTDGSKETGYSVARTGTDGSNGNPGADAINLMLDNESDTVVCDSDGNLISATTIVVNARLYQGSVQIKNANVQSSNYLKIEGDMPDVATDNNGIMSLSWTFNKGKKFNENKYVINIPVVLNGHVYPKSFTLSVSKNGKQGVQGVPGLIERTSEWATGVEFRNDENQTNGIRYLDIVTVTDNTTGEFSMYQCKKTHISTADNAPTGKDSTEWLKLNNMRPIYTSLIVAKNAVLRFAQTNRILITNSQDKVQGCFGGVEDEVNGYPLWIGGATASAAKFKVKYGGQLEATDATITGEINATSGKIAGFNISGNGLTNDNLNNDAYLIFQNKTKGCFAGIGGNVLPGYSGNRAVARFENEDKTNQWGFGKNIAMLLSAKNSDYNYAFLGTGCGFLNGNIQGYAFQALQLDADNTCFTVLPKSSLKFLVTNTAKRASIGLPSLANICNILDISQGTEFCIDIEFNVSITRTISESQGTFFYGRTTKVQNHDTSQYPVMSWSDEWNYQKVSGHNKLTYYFAAGYHRFVLYYKDGTYSATHADGEIVDKIEDLI